MPLCFAQNLDSRVHVQKPQRSGGYVETLQSIVTEFISKGKGKIPVPTITDSCVIMECYEKKDGDINNSTCYNKDDMQNKICFISGKEYVWEHILIRIMKALLVIRIVRFI